LYQSTAASETYTSLGFLVAIISVVTVNLLPRAKLIQMTFGICAFTAIAIPLAMLATWSGLQARFHTDPDALDAYNSSQSGNHICTLPPRRILHELTIFQPLLASGSSSTSGSATAYKPDIRTF
jgi:hypothetical protein